MSMKTIHKHEVPIENDKTEILLAAGTTVVDVEFLVPARSLFLWVEAPADLTLEKTPRSFKVFKSGVGIPESYQYLGTAIDQYQPEAYHVYEVL